MAVTPIADEIIRMMDILQAHIKPSIHAGKLLYSPAGGYAAGGGFGTGTHAMFGNITLPNATKTS